MLLVRAFPVSTNDLGVASIAPCYRNLMWNAWVASSEAVFFSTLHIVHNKCFNILVFLLHYILHLYTFYLHALLILLKM